MLGSRASPKEGQITSGDDNILPIHPQYLKTDQYESQICKPSRPKRKEEGVHQRSILYPLVWTLMELNVS